MNVIGKAVLYFETVDYDAEYLVENLDDTNVSEITITTCDGKTIKISSTQFTIKQLSTFDEETEEEETIIE